MNTSGEKSLIFDACDLNEEIIGHVLNIKRKGNGAAIYLRNDAYSLLKLISLKHKGIAEEFSTICGCDCFVVDDSRHPTYKIFVIL